MSSDDILVKVEGVSKKYCRELRRSLRYGLQDIASELLLRHKPSSELRRQEFWALQDVNFELRRGESFGIIGVNGSGKTTMLKMMQGLLKPTKGTITMRGKVGALITLGQGFQPLLTGRENIFINAAILGIPKAEVLDKMDDILSFAELGEFIDAPVKTYSSGMKGRLGFSIATNLIIPDVLLLDEVLATGDYKFKERCFQRMEEIVSSGATIVFVSHLVPKVERLCNRAMLLHKGIVKAVGPAPEVCEEYYAIPSSYDGRGAREKRKQFVMAAKRTWTGDDDEPEYDDHQEDYDDDPIQLHQIDLLSSEGVVPDQFKTLDEIVVRVTFSSERPLNRLKVVVQFLMMGDEITIAGVEHEFAADAGMEGGDRPITLDCLIPKLPMREGKYRVSVTISEVDESDQQSTVHKTSDLVRLTVKHNPDLQNPKKLSPGMVYMPASWRIKTQDNGAFKTLHNVPEEATLDPDHSTHDSDSDSTYEIPADMASSRSGRLGGDR